jgi:hypothetical protein
MKRATAMVKRTEQKTDVYPTNTEQMSEQECHDEGASNYLAESE